MEKQAFKERFERLYKGCELFAIHLDGFTHKVFYKDANGHRHVDTMSAYCPERYDEPHEATNGLGETATISFNLDKTKALFLGLPHCEFQNNARELVYKNPDEWSCGTIC